MKMSFTILIAFCLVTFISTEIGILKAQQVVATAGNHFENETMQMSWTLGEPVIKTIGDETYTLTQGMHQCKLIITTMEEWEGLDFEIKAYPNPTSDLLFVYTKEFEGLKIHLYDLQGKIILSEVFVKDVVEVDFGSMPASTYIMHIMDDNKTLKTFKIIKKIRQ